MLKARPKLADSRMYRTDRVGQHRRMVVAKHEGSIRPIFIQRQKPKR